MEIDEDKKIAKILKKVNKNKPQFGLGQVPQYGKSRSGREYGGFIKESVRKKMEFKPTGRRPDYYRRANRRRVAAILMTRNLTTRNKTK